jgi:hypothetical protein
MYACRKCRARIFKFEIEEGPCCKHYVLTDEDDAYPRDLFYEHAEALWKHSREINAAVSPVVIGVACKESKRGGMSLRFEQSALYAGGRCFIFALGDETWQKRKFPLYGAGVSYFFGEVGNRDLLPDDYPDIAKNAIVAFRIFARQHNKFLRGLIAKYGELTMDFKEYHHCRVEFAKGHLASGLLPIYRLGHPDAPHEHTSVAMVVDRFKKVCERFAEFSPEYEKAALMITNIYGVGGHKRERRDDDDDGYDDERPRMPRFELYVRMKLYQSVLLSFIPRLAEELVITWAFRLQLEIANAASHAYSKSQRCATANAMEAGPFSGTKWIPSALRGSPGSRYEGVQKCTALAVKLGPPTLFLTFTANSEWAEFRAALRPNESWWHHPHLLCRYFHHRLNELLHDLQEGVSLGVRTSWIVSVVEFQARGMPHAHLLVRLSDVGSLSGEIVDRFLSCAHEGCTDPVLKEIVGRFMVHQCRPERCHKQYRGKKVANPRCFWQFPKPYKAATSVNPSSGYWDTRRVLGDGNIVHYNANLLKKFQCHLNVEIAANDRSISYLFKYFHKGPTKVFCKATFADNVEDFFRASTLCSFEASWSVLGFPFRFSWPEVRLLPVVLPGEDKRVFTPESYDATLARDPNTVLHRYLSRDPSLSEWTYTELWQNFRIAAGRYQVKGSGLTQFTPRTQQDNSIAVMLPPRLKEKERFCLYLLLLYLPGCRSHEQLRAPHATFYDACVSRGIFVNSESSYWSAALEHSPFLSPDKVQKIFLYAYVTGGVSPTSFLLQHWEKMRERPTWTSWQVLSALARLFARESIDITTVVNVADFTDREFNLDDVLADVDETEDLPAETHIELTEKQRQVVDGITASIDADVDDRFCFLNGIAGSGKTTTIRSLVSTLRQRGKHVVCCAATGIAASLLPEGTTAHRLFGLPIEENNEVGAKQSTIGAQTMQARILQKMDVLVIDEISMMHIAVIAVMDRTLQDLRQNTKKMGGTAVICAGDFHQFGPVTRGSPASVVSPVSHWLIRTAHRRTRNPN